MHSQPNPYTLRERGDQINKALDLSFTIFTTSTAVRNLSAHIPTHTHTILVNLYHVGEIYWIFSDIYLYIAALGALFTLKLRRNVYTVPQSEASNIHVFFLLISYVRRKLIKLHVTNQKLHVHTMYSLYTHMYPNTSHLPISFDYQVFSHISTYSGSLTVLMT